MCPSAALSFSKTIAKIGIFTKVFRKLFKMTKIRNSTLNMDTSSRSGSFLEVKPWVTLEPKKHS